MVGLSLTPQAVASALDVGRETLDHWIAEGWLHTRSPLNPHPRIDLAEALRFIRRHRLTIHHPDKLGLRAAPDSPRAKRAQRNDLIATLQLDDPDAALELLINRYAAAEDLPAMLDQQFHRELAAVRGLLAITQANPSHAKPPPITPAPRELLCRAGDALWRLATLIQPDDPDAPAAMAAVLHDDEDPTPAALAALLLAEMGHRLLIVDRALTAPAIARRLIDERPRVLCLGLGTPHRPKPVIEEELDDLASRCASMGIAYHIVIPSPHAISRLQQQVAER